MAKLQNIAALATERIGAVITRARPVARGIALLASACGGLAYLVGSLVISGGLRYAWLVIGLPICVLPAWLLWLGFRRLGRAAQALDDARAQLQSVSAERGVRDALYELVETDTDPQAAPLIALGKELEPLRKLLDHREDLRDAWQTVLAITSLPGLMALGILGSFGLLIVSVAAVVIGLAVR